MQPLLKRFTISVFAYLAFVSTLAAQDLPFFVFNNAFRGTAFSTPEKQAELLKSLGYDGMELNGIDGLAETLRALDGQGLALYALYVNINLDNPGQAYDDRLASAFQALAGRPTMPWFYLTSKQYPPSTSQYDTIAVPILREIADMANAYGIKIMIYPHVNFWVDNVEDAIRIVQKANRKNLGITFNLCHFLADQGTKAKENFIPLVEMAMPHLFAISLNGAAIPTTEIMQRKNPWDELIKPLGDGNYDTGEYLQAFIRRGFKGPVGLQCYNIKENPADHLKRSIAVWRNIQHGLSDTR